MYSWVTLSPRRQEHPSAACQPPRLRGGGGLKSVIRPPSQAILSSPLAASRASRPRAVSDSAKSATDHTDHTDSEASGYCSGRRCSRCRFNLGVAPRASRSAGWLRLPSRRSNRWRERTVRRLFGQGHRCCDASMSTCHDHVGPISQHLEKINKGIGIMTPMLSRSGGWQWGLAVCWQWGRRMRSKLAR